jgi:hypothetical protein
MTHQTKTQTAILMMTACLFLFVGASFSADVRPPSVPLVACDPYFSIWSAADTLAGDVTRHWTGRPHPLTSLVRIDGKTFRLMGAEPKGLPALKQTSVRVWPTQTIYTFEGEGIQLTMTFLQAALPDDIDLMSRPVVYLTWGAAAADSNSHNVSIYFDAGMELVVNENGQQVVWSRENIQGLEVLKAGSEQQNVLGRSGDDVRIDWGYFYLAASKKANPMSNIVPAEQSRNSFIQKGKLPSEMDTQMPRRVQDNAPVMAMQFDLGDISSGSSERCQVVLAYDDIYSILYFGQNLSGFWKRDGKTIDQLLTESVAHYDSIVRRAGQFDAALMEDLKKAGGENYQIIGTLAYRQALAANKIVADQKGMPLMFSKENFSNGCMGTVDVFYPFAPQVLLLNPTLAKASFVPILEYGRSERWKFPFAPHDIGTYPHAMGQVYGGGERTEDNQMPVEESGNMILLVAAVVEAENNVAFAKAYWDVLTVWADYLKSKGLDPENQLCTDDFAGHLAHNVNLSLKAIVALGAYAKMAERMGETEMATVYRQVAEQYVQEWMKMADDGDHYRLAFDRPGTWSQKYNLIWDRVLGLNLFPESVAAKEMAYYKKVQKPFGLPLDNRSNYTKLDWILWTASITGKQEDFEVLIAPVVKFLNETPDRVPMTDWYWTHNARHRGFQARPVVGGVFIRLMDDRQVWDKWVSKADTISGVWAPLPKPPKIVEVVPTSIETAQQWYYVFEKPADDWFKTNFDAAAAGWRQGPGGFGTQGTPSAVVRTRWNSPQIWIRRAFQMTDIPQNLQLNVHHDEDAEIYLNGELAAKLSSYTSNYKPFAISEKALKTLKPGNNTIAIHCRQTGGGQYIDAGLVLVIPQE